MQIIVVVCTAGAFFRICDIRLQECETGAVELPKMLSDSQRICKVIVELIETERQYVRVSELAEFAQFLSFVSVTAAKRLLSRNFFINLCTGNLMELDLSYLHFS